MAKKLCTTAEAVHNRILNQQLKEAREYFSSTPFEESTRVMDQRYDFKHQVKVMIEQLVLMEKSKVTCTEERWFLHDAIINLEIIIDNFETYNCNIDAIIKKER
jgi:hypothetical protein